MDLITVVECAERLGIAESTLRGWIADRKIETVKVGGVVRVRVNALEAFIENGVRAVAEDLGPVAPGRVGDEGE